MTQLLLGRGLFAVHAFTATLSVPLTALAAYPLQDYPRLERYLASNHDPLGVVSNVAIFKRRGCASAPPDGARDR